MHSRLKWLCVHKFVFRLWQIGREYTPKQQGVWTAGYHEKLYNLTDEAIRGAACCCQPIDNQLPGV